MTSMGATIYKTDSSRVIARKMYYDADLLQLCSVEGFEQTGEMKVDLKGKLVMSEITRLNRIGKKDFTCKQLNKTTIIIWRTR